MEQIVIRHPNGDLLPLFSKQNVSTVSKATQKVALLSDDLLSITLSSAEPLNIGLGDVINVYGRGYRLNQLPSITKAGERRYDYELTLEGAQYDLIDVTFQLPEGCYGENLYTDLAGMIDALNWNVRRVFGTKWTISTSLTGTPYKNLTVTGKNCLQVAQEICSEFEVEFKVTITGDTVTMEFVNSVGITHDFTLKYGKGKGLYQLQRTNVNNAGVTTRLFCFGSGENLGNSYRHTKLCLPDKTRLTSYIEDAAAIAEYGVKEGEKVFEDIRPERVGSVTALESGDILSFYDTAMDFDLNEKDGEGNTIYLIPGTAAQIKFVSGNLGGYTFDLHSYDHTSKKFTINQFTDENGVKFPDTSTAARQFAAGDEYIITQINLPSSYITAAETKLQTEGTAALAKISQPQVSYKLTLDERFFIAKYGRIDTEPLHVGDSIPIQDTEVGVDKAVRITRIERDLLRPHSYEITLSDTVTKNTTVKVINELQDINETIYTSGIADVSKMRRRWMAVKELQEMVFDPDGYFDPENIKPLSVETAMLTVAAKSQQFALLGSLFQPNLGGACNDFYAQACSLAHYALFDYIVTFSLTGCTYSTANGNPLNTTTAYYIYARCSKTITSQHTGTGDLILSTTQYKAEDSVGGVDYYFFLIGVLNSAVDGVRAISLTYGATTINGAFITTGKITSQDGNCYVDLDGNAMAFKDEQFTKGLSWNHNGDGKLRIKGGLVVNGGGDEGTIGLYRGVYNTTYTYYPGDEVTYTIDGITSTYRHTGGADGITPTTGVAPTNTTYWMILANGKVGQSSYKSIMFVRMNATPTKPADNKGSYATPSPAACLAGQNSDGTNVYWSDGIPSGTNTIWATSRIFTSDGLSPQQASWSTPRPMTDTDTYDVEFAKMQTNDATPAEPDDTNRHGGSGTQIWFDPVNDSSEDFTAMYWRAERECKNGVWGSWTIVRIKGEKGDTGTKGNFKSTCFKRTNTDISGTTPTGGTYDSPVATGWSDGIPSGTAKVWATSCIFYGAGGKSAWSTPRPMTDTDTYDVEFAKMQTNDATPAEPDDTNRHGGSGTQIWFDPVNDSSEDFTAMYWRAERECKNGVWGDWVIVRIKGEKGDPGNPGTNAPYYKYKYQWSTSRTAYPTPFDATALNAGSTNWKDTQPTKPGTLYYLWRTTAKLNAAGTALVENWSTPVRVTPVESSLKIEVRGTKHNGTSSPAPYCKVYGENITGDYSRGHNLKVLNASTLAVVYENSYDTYTDTAASKTNTDSLVSKINEYKSSDYIIVLYSHDAVSMFSKLYGLLQKFGCDYRKPELIGSRFAFAFIGRWGLKPGQGYTKSSATEDTVDVAATCIEGELIASGSDGEPGENLVDNSEMPETYGVTDSSSAYQYIRTSKYFPTIPEGKTVSGQVRITLSGCTFPVNGADVLVYFGSNTSWPKIGELTGITANGTYELKAEFVNVNTGETGWNRYVHIRLNKFFTGGTVTIERVKVEVGAATEYSVSPNDRKGASTPYQGVYDSTRTYYGTLRRTDVVKYNDIYYVARADVGSFMNKLPTNTDYWNEYGAEFDSVATQLLFAEFAYVENLGVRDLQTAQSGKRVHISGDDNAMTIYDEDGYTSAVFSGDQFDDSELFGGADQPVTPSNTNRSYQSGNALHPDTQYTDNETNGTFNFPYAGVFSGQVVLYGKIYSTLVNSGTAKPTRMLYATVYVYLDNAIIGSARVEDPAGIVGGGDTATKTVTVPISQGIAAGNHTLKTRVVISVKNYTSGTLEVTAKSTFSNCKCSADIRMARYFANGQAVGCSASQYMEALLQKVGTAEKLLYKVRAGNCGIRLYDGTLQIMIAGTWYNCSRDSGTGALKLTAAT